MDLLDQFLNRVARELCSMPHWKREEELRELRSHLEQRVEDFEAQGLKPEEAQTRATEGFGSPKALGTQLCDAWEGVPTSWRGVAGIVLKVLTIAFTVKLAHFLLTWVIGLWPGNEFESPFLQALRVVGNLLFCCVSVYCGGLLSMWLGRRGLKVVLSLSILLWVVNAPFLAAFVVYTKMLLLTKSELIMFLLLDSLLNELPFWLLGAILFRFLLQRRWRNLPPGQAPNTGMTGTKPMLRPLVRARFGRLK